MALQRVPGTSRYVDTETGETLSRRQYEKATRPQALAARERTYRAGLAERREATGFISRERMSENKRYWLQRYSEQEADRRDPSGKLGITDDDARRIEMRPGSKFNRLWSQAERSGFDGGVGSAWDELTRRAGARGGEENEHERNKYLAVIAWYQRNDVAGRERWIGRGSAGRFSWEGMPEIQRHVIANIG